MPTSRLPAFHAKDMNSRIQALMDAGWLTPDQQDLLRSRTPQTLLDRVSENRVGTLALPLSLVTNTILEGRDVLLPFATEEPSIVASCSKAALLTRPTGGVVATRRRRLALGQVLIRRVDDARLPDFNALLRWLQDSAAHKHPRWTSAGGRVVDLTVQALPNVDPTLTVLNIRFDPADSMGANLADSLAAMLASQIDPCWALPLTAIVSNAPLPPHLRISARVPLESLKWASLSGAQVADRIQTLTQWAASDPQRCVTHNKGILNGIDALLTATYQDTRAANAALYHAAWQDGTLRPLAVWSVQNEFLVGELEATIPCGIAGGTAPHVSTTPLLNQWMNVTTAHDLEVAAAAAGLLQNLGALLALATEGIESGHLRLHARKHDAQS